jgi:hypothetical protein
MLAMVVNDNAGLLNSRGVLRFFASVLAPTGLMPSVGASMLAMFVADDAQVRSRRSAVREPSYNPRLSVYVLF